MGVHRKAEVQPTRTSNAHRCQKLATRLKKKEIASSGDTTLPRKLIHKGNSNTETREDIQIPTHHTPMKVLRQHQSFGGKFPSPMLPPQLKPNSKSSPQILPSPRQPRLSRSFQTTSHQQQKICCPLLSTNSIHFQQFDFRLRQQLKIQFPWRSISIFAGGAQKELARSSGWSSSGTVMSQSRSMST